MSPTMAYPASPDTTATAGGPSLRFLQGWEGDGAASAGFDFSEDASRRRIEGGSTRISAPILSAVINAQDFNALLLYAIDSDVGQGQEQELSGSFLAPGTAKV